MKKRGKVISIFGPDGSGKSTVANLLQNYLKQEGEEVINFHWRPGIIPYRSMSKILGNDNFQAPHAVKERSLVTSILILVIIFMDFILGYYLKVAPNIKLGTIIIYERYFYDICGDQARYGIKVPYSIRCLFSLLLPSPELIILLDGSADILLSRKKELSVAEINRQRIIRKTHLGKYKNCHIVNVDNNSPLEVMEIIFNLMSIEER